MRLVLSLLLAALLAPAAHAYEPESGAWWNPAESGTGYYIEIQDNLLGFMAFSGDTQGRAKWYTSVGFLDYTSTGVSFQADLISFRDVQPAGRPYIARPTVEPSYGTLRIVFDPDDNRRATLTWPSGHTIPIQRQEFYFVRNEDSPGTSADTLKMLGEWQVTVDLATHPDVTYPFTADVLVLDDYLWDNSVNAWTYEGCRPDDAQVGGCSTFALNNHDAVGYFASPTSDFPTGAQVIVVKDGYFNGVMWYILYELAIGTNDGSGLFTLYPKGTNPYNYAAYPTRAFRSASRTFVQEGAGPAKRAGRSEGLAAQLAAQGALPAAAKSVRPENAARAARLSQVRMLEARLGE